MFSRKTYKFQTIYGTDVRNQRNKKHKIEVLQTSGRPVLMYISEIAYQQQQKNNIRTQADEIKFLNLINFFVNKCVV